MTGRLVRLGATPVWSAAFQPLELRRSTRRTGADRYRLALLVEGEAVITCGRRETRLSAGDFYCDDGSRPHEMAQLLARFLVQVMEHTGAYRPADGPRLGAVLSSMAAALLTRAAQPAPCPPLTPRAPLTPRITAFIQHRLGDPELTPQSIAAAHGISLSYLHRLFEDESETVAAFVRRRRLERARFARATDFARAFRAAYGLAPGEFRRRSYGPGGRIAT